MTNTNYTSYLNESLSQTLTLQQKPLQKPHMSQGNFGPTLGAKISVRYKLTAPSRVELANSATELKSVTELHDERTCALTTKYIDNSLRIFFEIFVDVKSILMLYSMNSKISYVQDICHLG